MTIKRIFSAPQYSTPGDVALLLLRIVAGLGFTFHGWMKIQSPFNWMGPDAFAPPLLQALAALSEFGGGLAWIVGLLTPLASLGIACTMATATWFHAIKRGDPFVSPTGGPSFELALVFLTIALVLMTLGPGRISIDRWLFGKR